MLKMYVNGEYELHILYYIAKKSELNALSGGKNTKHLASS